MNFPFNAEAYNIFNNSFAFFGTVDLQGSLTNLEGIIFKDSGINLKLLTGQKFSETLFWQTSRQNIEKLETALAEAFVNKSKACLEFRTETDKNILIQLLLQPVFDEENNSKCIFFCARELLDADEKAVREVEKAKRDKDFFLAFLSHELRSPLNTILGWTKILLTKEINEAARKTALETIEKSARLQAKLIDDLVDSAKISAGKLRLESIQINLFEILKNASDIQKPLAEAKNVNLEFSSDSENISMFGDAARIRQMVTILVSTALKVTPSGGYIKIILETTENEVSIIVTDNGLGISTESLDGIFEPFQQNDEKKSFSIIAMGMELSIAKILAEKHNGHIRAESAGVGCGTTFTISLPLSDSKLKFAPQTTEILPEKFRRLDEINILVVEDDPDSREVLQLFLEQSGASVKSAESVGDAMSLIGESAKDLPDMIISDLAMPNEDGYSFLSRIRKLPTEKGGSIPAIALSAFASYANKQAAYKAGFQKYHTKPFEPDGLIQDILNLVKR